MLLAMRARVSALRFVVLRTPLILLLGCGATVGSLAERGEFREATCEYTPSEMGALEHHLEPALDLKLHLHVLDRAGADGLFDRSVPDSFHEQAAIVRLHYSSQPIDVDYFDLVPSAHVGDHYVNVMPDRRKLAELMDEEIPEPRRERQRFRGNLLAYLIGFLARPLRSMSGNPPVAFRGGRTVTNSRPASDAELARLAPATQRVHEQMALGCASSGVHCERFFILPRTDEVIRLSLARRIATLSEDTRRPFECSAVRDLEVELPPGGTLEERFAGVFGSGLRSAREVTTRGGAF